MKKLLIAAAGLCTALLPQAAPLTPEAALQRALGNAPARMRAAGENAMRLAATRATDSRDAIYVFTPAEESGFIAVAADDAVPALVGYSTAPLAGPDGTMAPGLDYWLSEMARQVDYAARTEGRRAIPKHARPRREPIQPLCSTRWNQSEPYNNLCPKQGMERSVTGCVATAMAQVMKYHNWPEKGTGSHSYSWGNRQLSLNFSKLTFEWDNMLDVYDESATAEQNIAVALLMQAAGYSVDMNYSPSGSGAVSNKIASALGKYFGYDKGMQYLQRDYYTLYDWEDIIYSNLAKDGPVVYGGQSYEGGHSFVCDGYDKDGYFHFNWGWGGISDGYFLLDLLDPLSQGIGGSGDNSGFDFMQDIVTGIRPDHTGTSEWTAMMVMSSGLNLSTTVQEGTKALTFTGFVYNPGPVDIPEGQLGLSIARLDAQGNVTGGMDYLLNIQDLPLGYGYSSFSIDCFNDLQDGDYLIQMDFVDSRGNRTQVPAPLYTNSTTRMHIENGEVTLQPVEPEIPTIGEINYPESIGMGEVFRITGRLVNSSDRDYYSQLTPLFLNENEDIVAMGQSIVFDVEANGDYTVEYHSPLMEVRGVTLTPGNYYIVLCTQNDSHYLALGDPEPVRITQGAGVNGIATDPEAGEEPIYITLSGIYAGNDISALPAGIYIERRGATARKVIVR